MSDREPRLKLLVNELTPIASKWLDIGVQLDLSPEELEVISGEHKDSIHGQLRCMLILWLKQVNPSGPTWQAVVTALRTQAINEKGLAAKLEEKYCLNSSTAPKSSSESDICGKHKDQELELYCMTCEEVVTLCFRCALELHKSHTLELLTTVSTMYQSKDTSPLNLALEHVNETAKRLEKRHEQILDQQGTVEAQIVKTTQTLQEALETRKRELTHSLHRVTKEKLGRLETQMQRVVEIREELSQRECELTKLLSEESPKESVIKGQDVVKKTKDVLKNFKPEDIESADTKFSVSPAVAECCLGFGTLTFQEVSPEKCFAKGKGLKMALQGQRATAILCSINEQGERCNKPLRLNHVECTMVPDGGRLTEQIDCLIKQVQPNQYEISYQPTTRGRHQLHIKVEGEHIKGSPFPVMVIRNIGDPIQVMKNVKTPWGIALDISEDKFVVTECKMHCISVFNRQSREKINTFGTKGSQLGQFEYTHGVAVDDSGDILVVDNTNHRIQKFTADGSVLTTVGKLGNFADLDFHYPHGIKIHPQNKMIYVADTNNHRIQILHPDLTQYGIFGSRGRENGQFEFPYDVAVDSNGDMYIADTKNDRIQVFTAAGQYLRQFEQTDEQDRAFKFARPHGIAISSEDILYVTEHSNHCVSIYTTQGHFLKSFGMNAASESEKLAGYQGIAVDKSGIVYVCDEHNSRICLF